MLVNRVGDMGLILAMFGILDRFGSLEFSSVFNMVVVQQEQQRRRQQKASRFVFAVQRVDSSQRTEALRARYYLIQCQGQTKNKKNT